MKSPSWNYVKCFFLFFWDALLQNVLFKLRFVYFLRKICSAPRRGCDFRTSWKMLGSKWIFWASSFLHASSYAKCGPRSRISNRQWGASPCLLRLDRSEWKDTDSAVCPHRARVAGRYLDASVACLVRQEGMILSSFLTIFIPIPLVVRCS